MDFWTSFWIAIIVGFVSWAAVKLGHTEIKAAIGLGVVASVAVPILVITFSGMMGTYLADNATEMQRATAITIDNLFTWLGKNIMSWIAGDFAGAILGIFASFFK
jgi:hypothetical protein